MFNSNRFYEPRSWIWIFQTASAGNLLFVTASAGMDVVVKNGNMNLAGLGSGASLKYITGTTFHLVGDLT